MSLSSTQRINLRIQGYGFSAFKSLTVRRRVKNNSLLIEIFQPKNASLAGEYRKTGDHFTLEQDGHRAHAQTRTGNELIYQFGEVKTLPKTCPTVPTHETSSPETNETNPT